MDSRSNPPKALIWDARYDQFELVDPSTVEINCIGLTPSTRQTCGNKIHEKNIAIAKSVTEDLLHPGAGELQEAAPQMRRLLSSLAKATLCQNHQDQAAMLSQKWYSNFEWCEPDALYAPSTLPRASRIDDWGHELRQDWKEVVARRAFRWEVNRERPRHLPSVMSQSLALQEQARREDGESEEREQEGQAQRERDGQACESERAREARYEAAMGRKSEMLAEQDAQAGEDGPLTQQSEAEKKTLREARRLQVEDENRHGVQTRAEAREQLRVTQESRVEKEEKARIADLKLHDLKQK